MYITKAIICYGDTTLSAAERAAKWKTFSDSQDIIELRHQLTQSGELLARGGTFSPDGVTLTLTTVWASQEAAHEYNTNPAVMAYHQAFSDAGFVSDVTVISNA